MPIVPTQEIIERAFRDRYGVAAINVVNDLSIEAVLAAAEELRAPVILQTSVKHVQMTGIDALYAMWVAYASRVSVPAALHLDHCPDRAVISACLAKGWNSVLFDASKLSVEENRRQCIEVVEEASRYGALVEGEIEGFKRTEEMTGDEAEHVQTLDTVVDFVRATGVDIFAPAIGNAHGTYKSAPEARRPAGDRHRRGHRQAGRAPRRHRHVRGAVRGPHRPGLREGQHQHRAQDRAALVGVRLPHRPSRRVRPAQGVRRPAGRGQGHGGAPHPAVRLGGEGLGMRAIVFDCDGVLADTERYGHLPAFNAVFREFGLPLEWSEDEYAERLKVAGGKERMASALTPEVIRAAGLPDDPEALAVHVAAWHRRKTALYTEMVAEGRLPPRPGVTRLIAEAQDAGWKLAVASTSAEQSVRAILDQAAGPERAARFDAVLAGDCVAHKKPAPDIYLLALERLAIDPADVIVVEDSRNGLEAATAAGLRCLVTVNGYTESEDFSEAALVVTSLGEPGGPATRVLANRSAARPGAFVTLADLDACLASD